MDAKPEDVVVATAPDLLAGCRSMGALRGGDLGGPRHRLFRGHRHPHRSAGHRGLRIVGIALVYAVLLGEVGHPLVRLPHAARRPGIHVDGDIDAGR
jgi:hypothetical protein